MEDSRKVTTVTLFPKYDICVTMFLTAKYAHLSVKMCEDAEINGLHLLISYSNMIRACAEFLI